MPQQTVELMQARATLREFTENALEPDPRPELVDRILVHRERTAQPFEHWAAQAAAGATFDAHSTGSARSGMPTLVHARRRRPGRRSAQQRPARARRSRTRALTIYPGAGHLFMWQEPERFVAELEEFLC